MTDSSDLARSGHASAEASDNDDAVEGDATEASDFVRETYGSWLDGDPEPTAWYAEWYLEIMLGHLSRLRNPPVGEELATIRADFMALVRPHLPGDLEQACYVAGKLSYARSDAIGEILDRFDGLLEADWRKLTIPDVVAVDDLPTFARETTRRRLAGTLALELRPPVL